MIRNKFIAILIVSITALSCGDSKTTEQKIDRFALVNRHNIHLFQVDTLGSLSVGNGEFAFTVDVSGLQSFPTEYENGISLGTQSQWAWHSIPSTKKFSLEDVAEKFDSCDGTSAPYAVQQKGARAEASDYLRANPHRLHLGLIGLTLMHEDGSSVQLNDLKEINQTLDLWTGSIVSQYKIDGVPVKVTLYGHPSEDGISAKIESALIQKERLKISFNFPYGADCHVCPGYDFNSPNKHSSEILTNESQQAIIKRTLDTTQYFTSINWSNGMLKQNESHQFEITPDINSNKLELSVVFSEKQSDNKIDFNQTKISSEASWKKFWLSGGAIDFSECTDPQANELERRVILSQYLTKIQCSGSMPPQETGLTMNSWFGKFHLEMHCWHVAHFAMWGRSNYMENNLQWYNTILPKAKATAQWQGYEGARWPKMTDPYGNESPSGIGAFIIWQQPHPIYLAEQLYRGTNSDSVLNQFKEVVFSSAEFMASFMKLKDGKYQLCHPLIPAQEIFKAAETDNPTYELQYWYYGLSIAQQWRKRLGLEEEEKWNTILENMVNLPIADNLYLPNSTTLDAYTNDFNRRDHPAVVGALGFLPYQSRIDSIIMLNTLKNIMNNWQWETTWGWDYPLLAMTATRLNQPELAIDALLMNVQKNTYLVNGHNYQDKRLRLYLPGNGGLLAAVALMTAGYEGSNVKNPGFPKNGKWNVKWERINPNP